MPETRVERVIFVLGLCAIGGMAVLIAFARSGDSATTPRAAAASTSTATRPATSTTTRPATSTTPSTTTTETPPVTSTTETPTQPRARGVRLQLNALQDSWVEVRSDSAEGDVLFVGIMPQGETQSFRGSQLYARFGNAGSLEARLNGDVLSLPAGTYSALVTPDGLQDLSSG